ncbi:MAG: putative ABC transporter permease [Atopobiaceae bacterium]|jgi:uncharacterized membrane protein|nr:putative ABC transporter permease [Atopobiaceae bacterium]
MFTTILGLLILMLIVVGVMHVVESFRVGSEHKKLMGKPHGKLSAEQRKAMREARRQARDEYLDSMSITWYQVVIIFVVGSVAGLLLEETWMFITAHLTQSRVGLVWGPFSPLYGFGATLLTIITFEMRKRRVKPWIVFLVAVVVGGTLEQITGWGMEHLFHAQSWTYEHLPDHITKYTAWRFLFFWGLLGLVWYKFVMPNLLYAIGKPTTKRAAIFVGVLAAYLCVDIFMTLAVLNRMTERDEGIPATNAFDKYLDENYTDEWIHHRFQNLVVETAPREKENA